MTLKTLQLSSCKVIYDPTEETIDHRPCYIFKKHKNHFPIYLFARWVDEIVLRYLPRVFSNSMKYGCRRMTFYNNIWRQPEPRKDLKGEIMVDFKISKKNEILGTLRCRCQDKKNKYLCAIVFTENDHILLKEWLEGTIKEWNQFKDKMQLLSMRKNWPNDSWKQL